MLLLAAAGMAVPTFVIAAWQGHWAVAGALAGLVGLLGWASTVLQRRPTNAVMRACGALLLAVSFTVGFENGGVRSQQYFSSLLIIYASALLFGRVGALVGTVGVAVVGVALAGLECVHLVPPPHVGSWAEAMWAPLAGFVVAAVAGAAMHVRFDAQRIEFGRTNALLQTEVKLRSHAQKELDRAYNAALEGTRVKTAFLANMSHELRTPMNAVVGLTDLLLRDQLTVSQRENLETVRESSQGLLVLLDDLLDLSKIEAGAMRLDRIDFSVREVLSQLDRLLSPRALSKNITLSLECAPTVPNVFRGDPLRLTQVLTNLVGNAIKFTSNGGVTVELSWSEPVLTVAITDTGIGMTPEQMSALFQPFSQADTSMTRRFGGTGLGLAIVKRLCELHQGDVKVTSTPGIGSTFTATLQYELGTVRAVDPVSNLAKPIETLHGLRVLVAEDNAINQRVAQRLLQRLGVTCHVVENGADAVEHVKTARWDVVLMDLQMPVMDGMEATRRIRALSTPQPCIIALSANAMEEDKTLAHQAGVNDFLAKPITLDTLSAALRRCSPEPIPAVG